MKNLMQQLPTRKDLEAWAAELGLQAIGITDVDLSEHGPHVRAYLAGKLNGDMGYLERNLEKRLDPALSSHGQLGSLAPV